MKKHSEDAKQAFIRKTYKARAIPRPSDSDVLTRVNTSLVKLWNLALTQCNEWLKMPSLCFNAESLHLWYIEGPSISMSYHNCEGVYNNSNKKSITPISLNFWLTGIRRENTDIESVSVVLEREMLRRLAGSFSSYFALVKAEDRRARPPQEKDGEKSFIALTWTEKSFNLNGKKLTGSIGGRVGVGFEVDEYVVNTLSQLPVGSKVAQVTVSMRDGEYWASFVCNIPRPEPSVPKGIMAIDLGAGHVAVSCSNGNEFIIPTRRSDKFWMRRIGAVETRAEKCKKSSLAWKRRMKARRIMHNKSQYQHKDHQRKLANYLAKMGMTMVVGKMKTRLGLAKSEGVPEQHRGIQNTGYAFRLLIFLREKAEELGLEIIEIKDPKRKGEIDDPLSKFNASRKLLKSACTERGVDYPNTFSKIQVVIRQ